MMMMMMMMMRLLGTEHKMGGERGCSCCLTMMVGEGGERGHGMLAAFVGSRWEQQARPPSSQSLFAWACLGRPWEGDYALMPSWGWSLWWCPLLPQAKAKAVGSVGLVGSGASVDAALIAIYLCIAIWSWQVLSGWLVGLFWVPRSMGANLGRLCYLRDGFICLPYLFLICRVPPPPGSLVFSLV
jgi:hypothetical protein